MKKSEIAVGLIFGALLALAPVGFAQEDQGVGKAIVTVLPKKDGDTAGNVSGDGLKLKVNGKEVSAAKLTPLTGAKGSLEFVVLIDSSARTSLSRQFDDIAQFIKGLPPDAKATIAYMQNGAAMMTGPLTADHAAALRGLHIPGGSPGSNASPYFCLSDLAKRWPSNDPEARRAVLMITDGVDPFNLRFDPDNPYIQAAIRDSVKARMVVYSIYWRGQARIDNTQYENNAGQSLTLMVTDATGGKSFYQGSGNPVSFSPYLDELNRRFRNQYELSFTAPLNGKAQVETMKVNFKVAGSSVDAPQQVFVYRPGTAEN
jgi:hypothetical protein